MSKLLTAEQKEAVCKDIVMAVNGFNRFFSDWMERTGCRANFGWTYGKDKAPKELVLLDIDARIYQRPIPPTLQDTLDSMKEKLENPQKTP